MKRSLLLLAVLLALPVLADTPRPPEVGKEKPALPVTVPFELLRSGHIAVQVKVNGKGPYRLVFDTGAPVTLVNNKLAREAGLLDPAAPPLVTPFGPIAEASIKLLEVGGQRAEGVAAVVMDHPTVELLGRALGGPLYGIVGFPFFARFRMTIDYEAKTLTFVPSGYKPPDVMQGIVAVLRAGQPRVLAPAGQWGLVASKEPGDEEDGLDVKAVILDSAAAHGGLVRGDRLLTLDGRWTDSVQDLFEAAAAVRPGTTVHAHVKRAGKPVDLKITPATGM